MGIFGLFWDGFDNEKGTNVISSLFVMGNMRAYVCNYWIK